MAAFSDLGANCFLQSCKEKDFLPFTCDNCGMVFCLEHRTPLSHGCIVIPEESRVVVCKTCERAIRLSKGETDETALTRHSKGRCFKAPPTAVCPVSGCGTKLTQSGSVVCKSCRSRICLAHRYQDSHNCGEDDATWVCSKCKLPNSKNFQTCSRCHTSKLNSAFPASCVIS